MNFENRARIAIIADMLKISSDKPARKTRMIYGANLSFKHAEQYLDLLTKANLLARKEGKVRSRKSVTLVTTANGKKFLKHYSEILKLAPFLK